MRRALVACLMVWGVMMAAGCGGGKSTSHPTVTPTTSAAALTPVPGNSELVVGANRFAVALIDQQANPVLGTSGNSVHLKFLGPDGTVKSDQDARFVWAIPNSNGFWAVDITFDAAGQWTADADVVYSGETTKVSFVFPVAQKGTVPAVGDSAIATNNLTLAQTTNMKRLSTDPQPDSSFYQMTVTEALAAKKPFVVVFATPAFCETRFCGPVLDNVKAVAPDYPGLTFIHIEPYELDETGALVTDDAGSRVPAQPTNDWHLATEPWVFVVGADGKISARFEGAASPDELRAAIGKVEGGA